MITLVTGASGHIGVNLVRSLVAAGRQVRVLIHENSMPPDGEATVVRGDVCDITSLYRACEGVEVVYHLAGRISIGADSWETLEKINVSGTRNVVEACLKSGVHRLVHFSSIHAMVQKPIDLPVDETRPLVMSKGCPAYDRSKAAGELEVHKGMERGLSAVIISPTAVIGPNDYRRSFFGEALLAMANGSLPALVGGGFDWVDVRDVAAGAMQAELKGAAGARYLLSGHWATVPGLAALAAEITGVKCPGFVCPMWLAAGAAPFTEGFARLMGKQPLFTRDSMRALRTCNRVISHEKAARELGYNPRPLRETIQDTIRWYEENGRLN